MILVDVNVLLYASDEASPHHERSAAWLAAALQGPRVVGFPLITVLAFLRISTNATVFALPLSIAEAFDTVSEWMALPTSKLVLPSSHHLEILRRTAVDGKAKGPTMTDAHLAALTIEHGATLCTTDRGFARFSGLDLIDPEASPSQ